MHISFTIQTGEKAPILPGQVSLAILMGKKKKKKRMYKNTWQMIQTGEVNVANLKYENIQKL